LPSNSPQFFELLPLPKERVWGRPSLQPLLPISSDTVPIGELWFSFIDNPTSLGQKLGDLLARHPEMLGEAPNPPLLVKLLFTTERLSVQVHPEDAYAQQHHQSLGKTEAWYVMDSEAPGEVAVGFRQHLTADRFRSSISSGEIEELLDWRKVEPGQLIFVPAGTVHAIGGGLTICEVQENSDITYRLYDYGRPRELHVEHGVRVSNLGPYQHRSDPVTISHGRDELIACEYFRIERLRPQTRFSLARDQPVYCIAICVRGEGRIREVPARAGQAWFIPAGSEQFGVQSAGSEWLLAYVRPEPLQAVEVD
jgi:mannose-6-phosphate isomerase